MGIDEKIYLLDGHSLAHRAFYALPMLTNSDGEYTNSVFGFTKMLLSLIDEKSPEYLAVAMDKEGKTFRHEEYEEYKADRKETPAELKPQFDKIKKVLELLKIPLYEKKGFEADDLIGTIANKAAGESLKVVIVSGDRDVLQLVDKNISVLYTSGGIKDRTFYDLEKVREEYELEPEQLVDMKGLMGDSSDNIPGVPLIGEKTATKLLKKFSDLETILDNIDKVSGEKRSENLKNFADQARMSKKLGLIDTSVPLEFKLEDCRRGEFDEAEVYEYFSSLGFDSLLGRFESGRKKLDGSDINLIEKPDINNMIQNVTQKAAEDGVLKISVLYSGEKSPVENFEEGKILLAGEDGIYQIKPGTLTEIWNEIYDSDNTKLKICQGKELLLVLRSAGIPLPDIDFEPQLASYLLNPSDSLPDHQDILKKHLKLDVSEEIELRVIQAHFLNKIDRIEEKLQNRLQEKNLLKLYHQVELPLLAPLAEMEYNGIKVDTACLNDLSEKWQGKIEEIEERAYDLAGEEFNLNSPQQVGEILFEKLELPVIKKTKTGYSTSMSVLEKIEDEHPIVPVIKEFRHWSKLKSTYLDALPPLVNDETGRIHTSFNQMVTATGRLSSTDPNLQNIPIRSEEGREIRKAFVPGSKDWKLLTADYSQIELRILAHISGDQNLIETFNNKGDIHNETARRIFNVESEDVTGNMRRKAKVINFGIAYGMSAYSLSEDLDIPHNEAEEYIERYFSRFSGVKKYMDEIVERAGEQGYVTTLLDRRRYIADINSSNYHRRSFAERTAINTPIQGSAADIMKLAMLDVHKLLQEMKARMLLQVHDELVLEVPESELEDTAARVKQKMENCYELKVPVIVDLEAGDNWRDKEKLGVSEDA
ncbi:DNA polymerase I [Halarsenatibacter silvermanii]|uniref:DNA polymerase I n=1 Tax=Halarsenatibacter silvermanii TaxID=321763 RepID=A0A1G9P672_9FIRM|nr:DNA polymerase I [Halarsenatibacter silvermanii]SDL94308.1 DNA polymerase I [Halarsenatibacter silvermanii]